MSYASSQLWSEFSSATPLGFDMDPATGTLFTSAKGTFVDAASEPLGRTVVGDDLWLGDLSEFMNEDIAAPVRRSETQFLSCQTSNSATILSEAVSSSNTDPHPEEYPEITNMLDNACRPPYRDVAEFELLSPLGEDALIFGASNFIGDCFLISSVYGNDQASSDENRSDSGGFIGAFDFTPVTAPVRGRARSKRPRCVARVWSFGNECRDSTSGESLESSCTGVKDSNARSDEIFEAYAARNPQSHTTPNFEMQVTPKLRHHTKQGASAGNAGHESAQEAGTEDQAATSGSTARNHAANTTASTGGDSDSAEATQRTGAEDDTEKAAWNAIAAPGKKDAESVQEEGGAGGGGRWKRKEEGGRRCRHCWTQKTPQWRAGPEGLKTLCNACGVRLKKKGRLFPEYRPVRSPSFSLLHHSNSHSRVLEMRRLKEAHTPTLPASPLPPSPPTFDLSFPSRLFDPVVSQPL